MTRRHTLFGSVVLLSVVLCSGCAGPKVDEKKALAEIRTEAQKMTSRELRRVAEAYGEAIADKREAVDDLRDRLRDLEPEELVNAGAATLKKDADAVAASISALSERRDLYIDLLHAKVDDEKPIADIEAEIGSMSAEKIRTVAEAYRQVILKKRADIGDLQKQLQAAGPGDDAAAKARKQLTTLAQVEKALVERFGIYVQRLGQKGGDTAALTLE